MSADTLGYPWPTDTQAPCEFASGGTSCTNPDQINYPGDKYDWYVDENSNGSFTGNPCGGASPSGECFDSTQYQYRNCTSYTAWRLMQVGVPAASVTGLHNGGQWYDYAPASEQSTTPKAWDAAVVPGNPGHVAFVESVSADGTQITVSEYNHDTQGHGGTRTGTPSSMGFTKYVDFGVHPTSDPDTDGDGVSDSNDWSPWVPGLSVNKGQPNDIIQVSGDVDGDHKTDVVAISKGPNGEPNVSWFHSTSTPGAASVASPQDTGLVLPYQAWQVDSLKFATGDFDGDHNSDLLMVSGNATNPPSIYVALSNGHGFYQPTYIETLPIAYWQWPLLKFYAGNFDGDTGGRADIIYESKNADGSPNLGWFQAAGSSGSPSFAAPAGLKTLSSAWQVDDLKWTVGDFDGDGKSDLFAMSGAGASAINMYIFKSNGTSLADFTPVKQPPVSAWQWQNIEVLGAADLDPDGSHRADIIYESRNTDGTPSIGWLQSTSTPAVMSLADGAGLAAPGSAWQVSCLKWAVGDYDGDGRADVFAASGASTGPVNLYVFLGTATPSLATPTLVAPLPSPNWQWSRLQW